MKPAPSESGSALLELSLVLPMVLFIFLGIVDIGLAISESMTVEDAARAGAEYGALIGNETNITGMQNAASVAANGLPGFQATATSWCSCSPNGSVVSCSSTCSGSTNPLQYVQVQTGATVNAIYGYPGLPASFALTGFAALRVQ